MPDIAKIKQNELEDILDFVSGVREYGHIYYFPVEQLDAPFQKILEGIQEVQSMMDESFSM